MALFTRKTNGNGEAQVTPAPASEALLKELNPLRVVVAGLRQRLEEEKKRCADLQKEYETACLEAAQGKDADPLKVQEDMRRCVSLIEGTEKLLALKQAEIAPLSAEYQRLRNAEIQAQHQEEGRRFVEETT